MSESAWLRGHKANRAEREASARVSYADLLAIGARDPEGLAVEPTAAAWRAFKAWAVDTYGAAAWHAYCSTPWRESDGTAQGEHDYELGAEL